MTPQYKIGDLLVYQSVYEKGTVSIGIIIDIAECHYTVLWRNCSTKKEWQSSYTSDILENYRGNKEKFMNS